MSRHGRALTSPLSPRPRPHPGIRRCGWSGWDVPTARGRPRLQALKGVDLEIGPVSSSSCYRDTDRDDQRCRQELPALPP